jgi:hypothetical protein
MAAISFLVAYGTTLDDSKNLEPSNTIYAEDLGLCNLCVSETNSCYACLTTTQQVFTDGELTSPVNDGYYTLSYDNGTKASWYVIGGFPQESGFYN